MNLEQDSRDTGIGEAQNNELFKKFCAVLTYLSSRIYRYLGLKKDSKCTFNNHLIFKYFLCIYP